MTHVISRLAVALAGRYEIERQIGEGGMCAVFDERPDVHTVENFDAGRR
jgi:hypothetical protein